MLSTGRSIQHVICFVCSKVTVQFLRNFNEVVTTHTKIKFSTLLKRMLRTKKLKRNIDFSLNCICYGCYKEFNEYDKMWFDSLKKEKMLVGRLVTTDQLLLAQQSDEGKKKLAGKILVPIPKQMIVKIPAPVPIPAQAIAVESIKTLSDPLMIKTEPMKIEENSEESDAEMSVPGMERNSPEKTFGGESNETFNLEEYLNGNRDCKKCGRGFKRKRTYLVRMISRIL